MLTAKPWKLEAVLRLILGLAACFAIGSFLVLLLPGLQSGNSNGVFWRTLVGISCFQGVALPLIWLFLRQHQSGWLEGFGFLNHPRRAILWGCGAGLIFTPVGLGLQWASFQLIHLCGGDIQEQQAVLVLRQMFEWPERTIMGVFVIGLAPIAEETLFRGILYPVIKCAGYPRVAVWLTSVLFAIIHFHLPSLLPLLVMALMQIWLYEATDNLLAPIVAHSLFNAVNFVMLFTVPSA